MTVRKTVILQERDILREVESGRPRHLYTLVGPWPVVGPVVHRMEKALVPEDRRAFNLETVNCGEMSEASVVERLGITPFFPGRKVVVLRGLEQALDRKGEIFSRWLGRKGDASLLVVIIQMDRLDRRTALSRAISRAGPVVVLDAAAYGRGDQEAFLRGMIRQWVEEANRSIHPRAMSMLMEEAGGKDLVHLKSEVEKLVSLAPDTIEAEHVAALTVSSRQDELFRLTDAVAARDLEKSIAVCRNLRGQGMHPLVILQTIANWLKRIAIVQGALKAEQGASARPKCNFRVFERDILPGIREYVGNPAPRCVANLKPFGFFSVYKASAHFDTAFVFDAISRLHLLDAEFKGGSVPDDLTLEGFVHALCLRKPFLRTVFA